jgi:very-short-patch-repair endonuclease
VNNETARSLRKRMTPQEVKLWLHLRELRVEGYHFRKQVPIAGYIVDFACKSWRVAIEVDGGQHSFDAHAKKDAMRDAKLAAEGYVVLRFWNNDIGRNMAGVVERIRETLLHR